MTDPMHLTDEGSEATEFERELLLAAQGVGLAEQDKRAIWAGVALQVLPAAGVGAASAGAAGARAAGASASSAATAKVGFGLGALLKAFVVVASLGGVSAGAYYLRRAPKPALVQGPAAPQAALSAAVQEAPVAARDAVSEPTIAPNPGPSADTAPSAPSHAALSTESPSALRDESAAVLAVRSTLRAGDASGALHLLEQARQRFPHGALRQEREALSIEALAKSGATDAASRKAEAFLRAHPTSPYAADVRSFIH